MESLTFIFSWFVFLSCKNYSGGMEGLSKKRRKDLRNMDNNMMIMGVVMGGGRKAYRGDKW